MAKNASALRTEVMIPQVKTKVNETKLKQRLETENFGVHLMLDAYFGDEEKLASMDLVFTVLNELPELLGMHKIITPYVVRADANDKKDPGGYSGFVMIAESHISIHTFPKKGFASIDVYTCQSRLDTRRICSYFEQQFGFKELEIRDTKRGLKFPKRLLS
ncbi:MAG TPA: adenosylmethionine decarboxylase [Patescibacteria group bacterium]|nr:adenosylmethionine decarboxylase [Patescibacteria group bacterium]